MAISLALLEYLEWAGVDYDVVSHSPTNNSMRTAEAAHVPGDRLAKGVILKDNDGYLMAVVPSTHRVQLGKLQKQLHRQLGLATEEEVASLFDDCESGAVPPVGEAFGYDVVIDDSLYSCPDIYFEAGDHKKLVHLNGQDFKGMMTNAPHGRFSRHV